MVRPEDNLALIRQLGAQIYLISSRVKDVWIPSSGIKAPLSRPAAWIDHGVSGAWEFDDQAAEINTERIVANIKFPEDMDKTVAPVFCIGWSSTTTGANCYWEVQYLFTAEDEDTTALAQETLASAETSSTQAEGLTLSEFTLEVPGATDVCIHIRITRRSDNGLDTINGDTVEIHGIVLRYTADILGTA